jgi:hypothetical protein
MFNILNKNTIIMLLILYKKYFVKYSSVSKCKKKKKKKKTTIYVRVKEIERDIDNYITKIEQNVSLRSTKCIIRFIFRICIIVT